MSPTRLSAGFNRTTSRLPLHHTTHEKTADRYGGSFLERDGISRRFACPSMVPQHPHECGRVDNVELPLTGKMRGSTFRKNLNCNGSMPGTCKPFTRALHELDTSAHHNTISDASTTSLPHRRAPRRLRIAVFDRPIGGEGETHELPHDCTQCVALAYGMAPRGKRVTVQRLSTVPRHCSSGSSSHEAIPFTLTKSKLKSSLPVHRTRSLG